MKNPTIQNVACNRDKSNQSYGLTVTFTAGSDSDLGQNRAAAQLVNRARPGFFHFFKYFNLTSLDPSRVFVKSESSKEEGLITYVSTGLLESLHCVNFLLDSYGEQKAKEKDDQALTSSLMQSSDLVNWEELRQYRDELEKRTKELFNDSTTKKTLWSFRIGVLALIGTAGTLTIEEIVSSISPVFEHFIVAPIAKGIGLDPATIIPLAFLLLAATTLLYCAYQYRRFTRIKEIHDKPLISHQTQKNSHQEMNPLQATPATFSDGPTHEKSTNFKTVTSDHEIPTNQDNQSKLGTESHRLPTLKNNSND